jgi:hypothetical protein
MRTHWPIVRYWETFAAFSAGSVSHDSMHDMPQTRGLSIRVVRSPAGKSACRSLEQVPLEPRVGGRTPPSRVSIRMAVPYCKVKWTLQ